MTERSYPLAAPGAMGAAEWQIMSLAQNPDRITTGLGVSLGAGRDVVLAAGLASVGGFGYENTANLTKTSGVNVSANPRVDVLVLGLNWATLTVTAYIKAGVPAVSPTAPLVDRTRAGIWEIAVAQWRVPGSSGTSNSTLILVDPWIRQEVENNGLSGGGLVPGAATIGITSLTLPNVLPGSLIEFEAQVSLKTATNCAGFIYLELGNKVRTIRWHSHDTAQILMPFGIVKYTARTAGNISGTVRGNADPLSAATTTILEVPVIMREILP